MQNCSTKAFDRRKIRVVVVDDSALMRQMLTSVLNGDPDIEVVGSAPDPFCARQMIKDLDPDVITLDIEMPKMDGLTFLGKIMTLRPMPVIMVSSLTKKGAEVTIQALECGALDFVAKPSNATQDGLGELRAILVPKVKAAATAYVAGSVHRKPATSQIMPSLQREGIHIVGIGASTGGVVAIQTILMALSTNCPGILVVQHMPPAFTRSFASRLNQNCAVSVVEANDGQRIRPGHAYIAPGGRHLEMSRDSNGFVCRLKDGDLVSGHRPSADVLFGSIARQVGTQAVGIILTGMGRDGAEGLLAMRHAGALTLGQDQASCVVHGMPRAAREIGAVHAELSLLDIAKEVSSASPTGGSVSRIS